MCRLARKQGAKGKTATVPTKKRLQHAKKAQQAQKAEARAEQRARNQQRLDVQANARDRGHESLLGQILNEMAGIEYAGASLSPAVQTAEIAAVRDLQNLEQQAQLSEHDQLRALAAALALALIRRRHLLQHFLAGMQADAVRQLTLPSLCLD